MEQPLFCCEKVSLAAVKKARCLAPAATARCPPIRFGTSAHKWTGVTSPSRRKSASLSAIAGTRSGRTKAPASISRTPEAISFSIHSRRCSMESWIPRLCRPSLGPTSTTRTVSFFGVNWLIQAPVVDPVRPASNPPPPDPRGSRRCYGCFQLLAIGSTSPSSSLPAPPAPVRH